MRWNGDLLRTALAIAWLAIPLSAAAQGPPLALDPAAKAQALANDTDPTKPVFFSLRNEFTRLNEVAWTNAFILRHDKLTIKRLGIKGPARGVLTRFDVPIVSSHTAAGTTTGLGDLYLQALLAPRIRGRFVTAIGTGLTLPTATSQVLGRRKWIAAPAIVPLLFFPGKGFTYVKFQDFISFAGDSNRPDVHYLTVTGSLLYRTSKRWWIVADTETNTNWQNSGTTWFKSGLLLGRMVSPRVGAWMKLEIPYGDYRVGEWILKASVFRTRL
jgi:hypothetical protein